MGIAKDKEEEKIYHHEKSRFNGELEELEKERQDLNAYERNPIFEFETIVSMLRKAPLYFANATYVQKRQIIEIFASNIVITAKKAVKITVNPMLQGLFSCYVDLESFFLNQRIIDIQEIRGYTTKLGNLGLHFVECGNYERLSKYAISNRI